MTQGPLTAPEPQNTHKEDRSRFKTCYREKGSRVGADCSNKTVYILSPIDEPFVRGAVVTAVDFEAYGRGFEPRPSPKIVVL